MKIVWIATFKIQGGHIVYKKVLRVLLFTILIFKLNLFSVQAEEKLKENQLDQANQNAISIDKENKDKENTIYIIGDSISEGFKSSDYVNNSWVGIVRQAFQEKFNNLNYGFISFNRAHDTQFHQYSTNFARNTKNSKMFGGVELSDNLKGNYVEVSFKGKNASLVYSQNDNGGVLEVYLDDKYIFDIDTSILNNTKNGCFSELIKSDYYGEHKIKLVKKDNKNTALCGMIYYEDEKFEGAVINNTSSGGMMLNNLPYDLLDAYTESGYCILALGVNDEYENKNLKEFTEKFEYICKRIDEKNGELIILDFIHYGSKENKYKIALRDIAKKYLKFSFLDFSEIFEDNTQENIKRGIIDEDGIHPTDKGHEIIAQRVLELLDLPYVSRRWIEPRLLNGWENYNEDWDEIGYYKDKEGFIHFKGLIKGGELGSTVFILPEGYRPTKSKVFSIASTDYYENDTIYRTGILFVYSNGEVKLYKGSMYSWNSLEGIIYNSNN